MKEKVERVIVIITITGRKRISEHVSKRVLYYVGRPTSPHPAVGALLYVGVDEVLRKHAGKSTGIFASSKRQGRENSHKCFAKSASKKAPFAFALTTFRQPVSILWCHLSGSEY